MIQEFKIYDDNCNVKIDITEEKKTLVFEKILEWCKNHDCISGEKLCQNDKCNIDSPDLYDPSKKTQKSLDSVMNLVEGLLWVYKNSRNEV